MITWLKSLFRREPPRQYYTVHWCETVKFEEFHMEVEGVGEVTFGGDYTVPHCERYLADSPATALAMHRSDNPGRTPTRISYWK